MRKTEPVLIFPGYLIIKREKTTKQIRMLSSRALSMMIINLRPVLEQENVSIFCTGQVVIEIQCEQIAKKNKRKLFLCAFAVLLQRSRDVFASARQRANFRSLCVCINQNFSNFSTRICVIIALCRVADGLK